MLFKYSFVTFVLAGAHAHEAQDTVRRLRQQRYAKSNKASKRMCHLTGSSQCPYQEIEINKEAAKAHKDHHGDSPMSCSTMCHRKFNNVFDKDTCRCVDLQDPPENDVGCMPERLLEMDVDFGRAM